MYTPNQPNPFTEYRTGDEVHVFAQGHLYDGIVCAFPRNSVNDTDVRMQIKPLDASWFGRLTISNESDWYGNHHISQVTITRI